MRSILTILFIGIGLLYGQDLKFKNLSSDNGLSQGTVLCMHQDQYGFIWIGTDDGLNLFDGYNISIYKYNPNLPGSISDNSIYDICEDRSGNLWIATGYGLNRYNVIDDRFDYFVKDTSNQDCVLDNQVRCVEYDSVSNTIWVGSDLGNLIHIDLSSGDKNRIETPWQNEEDKNLIQIRSLFIDNNGLVWIGTNGLGIYCYNVIDNSFKQYYQKCKTPEREVFKNKITVIYQDNNGDMWIGSDGAHISFLDTDSQNIVDYGKDIELGELKRKGKIRDIIQERNGRIWVASYGGLFSINSNHKIEQNIQLNQNKEYSLSSNRLLSLMFDVSGSLWIGNYEKGIDVLNQTTPWFSFLNKNEDSDRSLNSNIALSFAEDDSHNLYIGTYEGLNHFNRKENKIRLIENNAIKKGILSICYNSDESIWLGSWGTGLIEYNALNGKTTSYLKDESKFSLSNNTVLSVYQDPTDSNLLWVGTFDGLNRFNKQTKTFEQFGKKDGFLSNIVYHISGNADTLWVGTKDGGLSIVETSSMKITNYMHDKANPKSISNNVVLQVTNADSLLYVATKRGLNLFHKADRRFSSFDESDGLASSNIWAVIPDNIGRYWITSNSGLSMYDPRSSKRDNPFRNFSVIDGIQGNEFNQGAYFYSKYYNEIFIGGINGLNYFNPEHIEESEFLPPVRVTSFKLFDEEAILDTQIFLKHSITLPYHDNFVSFEFTSLDYGAPENILYSVKMAGLDKNWSTPSSRRFASYPDLKPGSYQFLVKATNSQGFWNNNPIKVNLTIKPPFWQTTWFVLISIVSLIAGIVFFVRWREAQLQNEKKILEETVFDRTTELRKKNHDITSSIQYAKRIQEAIILPNIEEFSRNISESFVLFKPKDIVSGDFFWYTKINHLNIYAVADCTGHGVPGAFMSIIGNSLLEKIVNEAKITEPNEILDRLKSDLVKSLNQGEGGSSDTRDGMDIAIISIEDNSRTVSYSGAYRPLIRISKGELIKYQADKISIGGVTKADALFTKQVIDLDAGDCIYVFSDGYPDQFGGPKNKKFLLKRLNNILLSINDRSMVEQDMVLDEALISWMGSYSQIDDILLVGLRV